MKTFNVLLHVHIDIDEMFLVHQYSLLHYAFGLALEQLERYEAALLRHMEDEEDILLPLFSQRAGANKGGSSQHFLDDHTKMRGFIKLFKEQTALLAALSGEERPEGRLLALLDREAFYKRLCSHHDKREKEVLYPFLDECTTETEKNRLLEQMMTKIDQAKYSAAG